MADSNEETHGGARPEDQVPRDQSEEQKADATSQSGEARSLLRLWLRVGGWFVTMLGFLTIIGALRLRQHWEAPPLIVIGLILMGVAYALAGQSFSEGRAWATPLAIFACVTCIPFSRGLSLVALIALMVLYSAADSG
ncbi:MAG: hypothetical protein M3Y56_08815, partial [Armatimonadota bacterium]|nr:hypothetical protein [Armatimonadota bacterium]